MTNPDEMERAVERLTEMADWTAGLHDDEGSITLASSVAAEHSEDLRLILSANREMRKALEFYADEPAREFPSDGPWGVNSDDFGRVARSALLTTQVREGK